MSSRYELTDVDDFNPGTIGTGPRCSEWCPYLHHDDIQTQGEKNACVLFRHAWHHFNWPPPRCRECRARFPYGATINIEPAGPDR